MTILIDVRSPEEYAAGHIEEALNIPVEQIAAGSIDILEVLPKEVPLSLYCLSGARAERACRLLQDAGFSAVTNLGGIQQAMEILRGAK